MSYYLVYTLKNPEDPLAPIQTGASPLHPQKGKEPFKGEGSGMTLNPTIGTVFI